MFAKQWYAHTFTTAQIYSSSLNICANGANDHPVIICMDVCAWDTGYLYNELKFTFWKKNI